MKEVLKWIASIIAVLVGVIFQVVAGLGIYSQLKFKPVYADRPIQPITADTSPEGLARGKYLMERAMNCTEACHSGSAGILAGNFEEINQGPISVVFAAPNITPDIKTGIGAWTDAEIARAIREGIDKDGIGLVVMPSHNYHVLSDADVAAVVGYLRNVEPVSNQVPPFKANFFAKILNSLGMFGPNPVGDPITAPQTAPSLGSVEYGSYLVKIGACSDCHGEDLAGGPLPMASPDDPIAANLTPGGELIGWSVDDFIKAVREGIKPSGKTLAGDMPRYGFTDEDLAAIFAYLKTITAVQPE